MRQSEDIIIDIKNNINSNSKDNSNRTNSSNGLELGIFVVAQSPRLA